MSVGASRISLFEDDHEIKAYRLSELLGSVRRALEASFRGYYRIVAEVASINSSASSGHVYLELTETNKSGRKVASTRATMWSGTARSVMQRFCDVTGSYPQVGMELLMTVSVTFHEQYGFSLNIQDIDPNHTLGNLERIRRETIQKLRENGILDLNKVQCTLPTLTQRIAVISSETAAGWGDFRDQMRRSALAGLFHFDLYPATMQGATTTKTVISALDRIYSHADSYDAVVILRGGGSPIDLSAFDDYRLCEYIANFCLPVITAIGHERDFSVADHVANTSVKTPTAAAEFLIHRLEEQVSRVVDAGDMLSSLLLDRYHRMQQLQVDHPSRLGKVLSTLERRESDRMRRSERRLTYAMHAHQEALRDHVEALAKRSTTLLYDHRMHVSSQSVSLESRSKRLSMILSRIIPQEQEKLDNYTKLAELYNPEKIMLRGFLPVLQGGRQLTSISEVDSDSNLQILMTDGSIEGKVTRIHTDKSQ